MKIYFVNKINKNEFDPKPNINDIFSTGEGYLKYLKVEANCDGRQKTELAYIYNFERK